MADNTQTSSSSNNTASTSGSTQQSSTSSDTPTITGTSATSSSNADNGPSNTLSSGGSSTSSSTSSNSSSSNTSGDTSSTTSPSSGGTSSSTGTTSNSGTSSSGSTPSGSTSGSTSTGSGTSSNSTNTSGATVQQANTSSVPNNVKTVLPIYVQDQTVETDIGSQVSVPTYTTNTKGALQWTVQGELPDGISIDPNSGLLSGSPIGEPSQDTFMLQATDATGNTGTGTYTVIVNPALGGSGNQSLTRVAGYSLNTSVCGTGGTGNYQYSLANPPAGVVIGKLSGVISGSIGTAGTTVINVVIDDGAATTTYPVTFTIQEAPTPNSPNTNVNFTRRRIADIGMAKLEEAIALRSQTQPEYLTSGQDLLDATKKLIQDPTDDFLNAYANMHQQYGSTFMMENEYFIGMDTFSTNDFNFMDVMYWAFRQVIYYQNVGGVDWNQFLRTSRSQKIRVFLFNYNS